MVLLIADQLAAMDMAYRLLITLSLITSQITAAQLLVVLTILGLELLIPTLPLASPIADIFLLVAVYVFKPLLLLVALLIVAASSVPLLFG